MVLPKFCPVPTSDRLSRGDGRPLLRQHHRRANPIAVEAGEVIVFTHGDAHVMSSSPGMRADRRTRRYRRRRAARLPFSFQPWRRRGASAKLVCGYLACDARPFNPLLESLAAVIKAGDPRGRDAGWLGQFIHVAVAEVADKRAGSESVLDRAERTDVHRGGSPVLETLPAQIAGWLAGLRDPFFSKALSLIHAEPAHSWTIEGLARAVGLSRSVLAERFAIWLGFHRCIISRNGACRLPRSS